MGREFRFAQKGLVFDETRTKVLVHKYSGAKFQSAKLAGKLGFPGGRLEFGETPDESFIRELLEETGIKIRTGLPSYVWTWSYKKEDRDVQIVAVSRLAYYESGEIKVAEGDDESTIEKTFWLEIDNIVVEDFIIDEQEIIRKFLEYRERNPF